MTEKPPPYGKEALCPLVPGPGQRLVACERERCSWRDDGCCSLVPLVVKLARENEAVLRRLFGDGD